jgi:glycosyltransferase involved in cell wall biosynthesis
MSIALHGSPHGVESAAVESSKVRIGPSVSPCRSKVAFVVNGTEESAMGERARSFADRLSASIEPVLVFRGGRRGVACLRMLRRLQQIRPRFCCVFDLGIDGFLAAFLYRKATGVRFAVDTGDDVVALGKALGRGRAGMFATRMMDKLARSSAAAWIVRGTLHRSKFADEGVAAEWIPDGVDVDRFAVPSYSGLAPPDAANPLVVGMLGSVTWIPTRGVCYGWELVELVAKLQQRLPIPVRGEIIGDGTGVDRLKHRCREIGIERQIEFRGRVPYSDLPAHLHRWHIALSTQSNDAIGNMRTTGKLPLYLAAGRFVLASDVGEAARLLPSEMLCTYRGEHDPDYPNRLADRIAELIRRRVELRHRPDCVELARTHFDYDRLSERLERTILRSIGETS